MRLFVVGRNADHLDILFVESAARITERTCFERSARRVVFRVEPEHDALAAEILEANRISVLVL